jgi:hypothetical protein
MRPLGNGRWPIEMDRQRPVVCRHIRNFGRDYAGARDEFIYSISRIETVPASPRG